MRIVWALVFLSLVSCGSPLDDYHMWQGERAYFAKEYKKALHHYEKIGEGSDEVSYNKGNILYRLGEFQAAIKEYKKIKNPTLLPKALHNLGNSYAKIGNIKQAIASYKKALTIDDDRGTKANLDLLTKKNEEKEKQSLQEDRAQQPKNENHKPSKQVSEQSNREIERKRQQMEANGFQKERIQNEKQTMGILGQKLSNEEEQKWSGVIERRGIRTILIPIETKEYK